MLSVKDGAALEPSNGSARGPCDSSLSELRGLDGIRVSKYYPRGYVLFAEGQRARGIYILCEGRAKVSIASAEGKTIVLGIARSGEILGINAALTGQPHAATVQTIDRSRIDFVAQEDLMKLLERDKKAYADIAHVLSMKLNSVLEHTRLIFLSHSSGEKLARLLVKWCDEHGKRTSEGIYLKSGLTHEEMAQMICASRETVTRELGELKRKNIVTLVGSSIFVRNRKALEALMQS